MAELVHIGVVAVSGAAAIGCLFMTIRIFLGNSTEYSRNQRRAHSFMRTLRGKVPTVYDGTRDSRVSAGIAVNRKTNRWEEQGHLSNESVAAALRRPQ